VHLLYLLAFVQQKLRLSPNRLTWGKVLNQDKGGDLHFCMDNMKGYLMRTQRYFAAALDHFEFHHYKLAWESNQTIRYPQPNPGLNPGYAAVE
jgi:hypothetical protein